jgi:23S rRNA G2069 N7-methylase RlmK/C1962 C5-methylase RlmI
MSNILHLWGKNQYYFRKNFRPVHLTEKIVKFGVAKDTTLDLGRFLPQKNYRKEEVAYIILTLEP